MAMVFSLLLLACLATAAWRDLVARIIPDTLPLALLFVGLAWRLSDGGVARAGISLGLAVVLFLALAALHAAGWLGGGDVKLAAGCAAGLAPHAVLPFITATGIAGGVLAALHLALRRLPPGRRAAVPAGRCGASGARNAGASRGTARCPTALPSPAAAPGQSLSVGGDEPCRCGLLSLRSS